MDRHLFRVIFHMVALELDKLVKSKFGKRLALSRVLPSYPGEVLKFQLITCSHEIIWNYSLVQDDHIG